MTLYKKTLFIVALTLVILIALLYGISQITIRIGFEQLEEDNTRQNVQRALSILSREISDLDSVTSDWASWDDTYNFIEDTNTDYIETNLVEGTFVALRLNLILYIDSSGNVGFSKAFDIQSKEEIPVPQSLLEYISPDGLLLLHPPTENSVAGILSLPENPILIASRPILTSEEEGPIRGTLIMGRYLDDVEVQRLSKFTYLSLTIQSIEDLQMPSDFEAVYTSLYESPYESPIVVRPLTAESVAGYALLKDIYGKPIMIMKVTIPRDIHQQGQNSMYYFILSLAGAGLVFGGLILVILEKSVLSRLAKIATAVNNIRTTGDMSGRVTVAGNDELAGLADNVNNMLETLQDSQRTLQDMATKDYLTGLWNHREFQTRLAAEIARAQRSGGGFSLLFLDVDNFKSVNSLFGHQRGDDILTVIAKFLKQSVRISDIVARYGGDEFTIILPDTMLKQASILAEHLQETFNDLNNREAAAKGFVPRLGLSIGIASYSDDTLEAQELIRRANQAMLHAKSLGGGRLQVWSTIMQETDIDS